MGKNSAMLKVFLKAMKKDKNAVSLVTPKSYVKSIYDIDYKCLKKMGYKNLVFDIDNTIMPVNDINVQDKLKNFIEGLKKDFKVCILSNNNISRVNPVKESLNVLSLANAKKPNIEAYNALIKLLDTDGSDIVMIGDQMLSDIVFANKYKLYSILVEPYDNKYDIKTGTSRVLQNILMKKLKDKIKRYDYY